MSDNKVNLRIKFPWWMNLFIVGCGLFGRLMNLEPDRNKIKLFVLKHTSSQIKRNGKWILLKKDLR